LDVIEQESAPIDPSSHKDVKENLTDVQQIVKTILDDIITNTYSFIQLKSDLHHWRGK
jgi:hypothetical protein